METLDFKYKASDVTALIDAETSRHAAFLKYQDGGSAYDELKIHTNDQPTIDGFVADAFRTIVSRMDGDGKYAVEKKDGEDYHVPRFYLPDFDDELYKVAEEEMSRYAVLSSTARWLMTRSFGEYAKMVAEDANASLARLVTTLRTRKFPFE